MKILIGVIVILGLGWFVLGTGGDDAATDETNTEEVMEEGEAMEEGEGHDGDAMMEEGDAKETGEAMIEAGAEMEATGEAMQETGEAMVEGEIKVESE